MIYTIPVIPPSNNRYLGRENQWDYRKEKKIWQDLVAMCCHPRPEKPVEHAQVILTYFFPDKRRRDPDNYSGKMVLDGLVRAGILVDDSFSHIDLLLRGAHDRKNPRLEIQIKEM